MNDSSDSGSGSSELYVDPYKMAKRQQVLRGTLAVQDLQRAKKLLAAEVGEVAYELAFNTDSDNLCYIDGHLGGKLTLCCQRCLQPFVRIVKFEFSVSPVSNDQDAKLLTKEYEPVMLQAGNIDLHEFLEDELILALPIVALHEGSDANCKQIGVAAEAAEYGAQELENPFQVLQKLKANKNGQQPGDE